MAEHYRIDPAAARAAVAAVQREAEHLSDVNDRVQRAIDDAVAATPGTATAGALSALAADPLQAQIDDVQQYVQGAAGHVAKAVEVFVHGDLQMAEDFDRAFA